MSYLLDTSICIPLLNGSDPPVRLAYEDALLESSEVFLSTIVLFELQYGVRKSSRVAANEKRLRDFLETTSGVLPFTQEDSLAAGSIRAELEKMKMPIGHYDTLIAGQALARGLTLVTANGREFSRVKGLRWVDWAKG